MIECDRESCKWNEANEAYESGRICRYNAKNGKTVKIDKDGQCQTDTGGK